MQKSDMQLVSETILDTQGSFDELVRRYTKPLYHFSYRLTGNIQAAEDCVQETFIKVWKNLKKYNPNQNFRGWIFTIARNTITDYLRKKKSIPFSNLTYEDFSFEESISDSEPLPDEILHQVENNAHLDSLLNTLPSEPKTILILHYYENMTFEEISTIMKKPMNTVKSLHRRALLKLRDLI